MEELIIQTIFMVLIPFLLVALFTPVVKRIAIHMGALDIPNERKVHKKPIPRMGGLAIYFGFLLGYMIYGTHSAQMNSILIGSFVILIIGIIDDVRPLDAKYKFIGQIVAALILVLYGNFVITDINLFGFNIPFGFLSIPVTIFFILGCINCINLIDGLDGLASGISSIYFLTIGIITIMRGSIGLDYILSFIMLGSTLGFLVHNFYPASIFMGDSGSMFLGFIISAIALLGFKNVTMTSLVIPLLALAVPILDTLFAILRRLLKKESIGTPDKFHIHHQFLKHNFSQRKTVLIIYAIDLLFAVSSIFYVLKDSLLSYIIYIILLVLIIIFVWKTDVVFEHHKKESKK